MPIPSMMRGLGSSERVRSCKFDPERLTYKDRNRTIAQRTNLDNWDETGLMQPGPMGL